MLISSAFLNENFENKRKNKIDVKEKNLERKWAL
jgi:hypothetical protein